MKKVSLSLLTLFVSVSSVQAETKFDYPKLIECKPDRVVSINLPKGIADDEEKAGLVNHTFVYIANGRYQFKSGLASFASKLTNQDEVLNLYSGNTTYSIAIYTGEYIGTGVHHAVILPNNDIVGGTANGSFFEGKCKITW